MSRYQDQNGLISFTFLSGIFNINKLVLKISYKFVNQNQFERITAEVMQDKKSVGRLNLQKFREQENLPIKPLKSATLP